MARWKVSQLRSLLTKLRLAQEVDGDKFKDFNFALFGEMDERVATFINYPRQKWTEAKPNLKTHDTVLVICPGFPRAHWPLSSNRSAKINPVTAFPLRSVCVPFEFPREECVSFINMHNRRLHDVTYCYKLEKNAFLHTNKRHSRTMKTIRLPGLAVTQLKA